jgi:penicillin-binding protein 1A
MEPLQTKHKKYLKIFGAILLTPILLLIILLTCISLGWMGYMPTFEDLDNPQRNIASEVYSNDGKILGTYYIENRNTVEYKDLSPFLVNALVAREDHRFYKHSGVDMVGLCRVFGKTVLLGKRNEGGGSTISQQLAKNLFPRDTTHYRFGIARKIVLSVTKLKEWVIAIKLEHRYSKEEIITMYFNTVPFGSEAYGIKTGCRTYFNKSPDSLKIEEAALMVAMLKGTYIYDPKSHPKRALFRRNSVLAKMAEEHYITKAQYDSLSITPMKLNYQPQSHKAGLGTYLREYIRVTMNKSKPRQKDYSNLQTYREDSAKWTDDPLYGWCNKNLKPDGTKYNLYRDGLKIYTTVDSRMQEYAEKSVVEHLSQTLQPGFFKAKKGYRKAPFANNLSDDAIRERLTLAMKHSERYMNLQNNGLSEKEIEENFRQKTEMRVFTWKGYKDTIMAPWDSIRYAKFYLRASFLAVDPHNGFIKAYVGGPDMRFFKYDGVMMQKRQIGSTIKPFLFTVALNEGYNPCDMVWNNPVSFPMPDGSFYTPQNDEITPYDGKEVTLTWGLAHSVNNVTAFLLQQFKYEPLFNLLRQSGIRSELPEVPSVCLGTPSISMNELVGAYTIFANRGIYSQPILVSRIENKYGKVIRTISSKNTEVLNSETAYSMLQMLMNVVRTGTGARIPAIYNLRNEIGGKTGTTQNHSDGWFIGVTPDLVAGAWVGGDEPSIHFDRMTEGQGSAVALPIFAKFLQKVYADKKINLTQGPFEKPENYNINTFCPMKEIEDNDRSEYLKDEF